MKCGVPAARAFGALAKRADNRSGLVDSTFEQIAQDARMSRSQAAAGVAKLIELGLIEQVRKGNSRISSKYRLPRTPLAVDRPGFQTVKGPDSHTVDRPETRTVEPAGPSGNPDFVVRISGPPLVSPVLSPTTSLADGEDEGAEHREDDGGLPGLLLVAPESETKAKPKTRARRSRRRSYPEAFEAFWTAYPQRADGQRGDKVQGHIEWEALLESKTEQVTPDLLIAAAKAYAATKPQFVYNAHKWLSGDIWKGHVEATSRAQAGELSDAEIVGILGPDSYWTPPPYPPGVLPGSPQAKTQRARDLAERRAERLAEALTRLNRRSAS
jgi:hypothetical protein